MNSDEVTMLLTRIQVLDNRQVDRLTIEAWTPLMEDIDYSEAVDAVNKHFHTSTAYLVPAHIVAGVVAARNDRAERQLEPSTPGVPKPANYDAMVRAAQDAVHAEVAQGHTRGSVHVVQAALRAAQGQL